MAPKRYKGLWHQNLRKIKDNSRSASNSGEESGRKLGDDEFTNSDSVADEVRPVRSILPIEPPGVPVEAAYTDNGTYA